MRHLVSATLACLAVGLAATAGEAVALQPRIVGGSDTTIQDFPWQVGIDSTTPYPGFFCGGVILDATHVLTAAHCARTSGPGSPVVPAASYTIYLGTTHIDTGDPTSTTASVTQVVPDPSWDGSNHDAAVLTLSAPIALDGTNRMAIGLAQSSPPTGTALSVSGWGTTTENGSLPNVLQQTTVNVTDFNQCKQAYHDPAEADLISADVLCAAAPGRDSCQGDSGGPLVDFSNKLLVGIVSSGIGCAQPAYPGIYTSVTGNERQFIVDNSGYASGLPAPQLTGASPALSGTPMVGNVLHCSTGVWSGSPVFTFSFLDQSAGGTVLTSGATADYSITSADVGRMIACRVQAGSNSATSNRQGPIPAVVTPPPPPPPPPAPVTTPAPTPTQPAVVTVPKDTTAPHASVTSAKCTRTRCVLHVTALDPGFSSGIAGIEVRLRTTATRSCVVNHRRRSCTHKATKTLHPARNADGTFTVVAGHLAYGSQRFSITAIDNAGNRQATPTTRTATTRAPRAT